jgi:hypothetical protein
MKKLSLSTASTLVIAAMLLASPATANEGSQQGYTVTHSGQVIEYVKDKPYLIGTYDSLTGKAYAPDGALADGARKDLITRVALDNIKKKSTKPAPKVVYNGFTNTVIKPSVTNDRPIANAPEGDLPNAIGSAGMRASLSGGDEPASAITSYSKPKSSSGGGTTALRAQASNMPTQVTAGPAEQSGHSSLTLNTARAVAEKAAAEQNFKPRDTLPRELAGTGGGRVGTPTVGNGKNTPSPVGSSRTQINDAALEQRQAPKAYLPPHANTTHGKIAAAAAGKVAAGKTIAELDIQEVRADNEPNYKPRGTLPRELAGNNIVGKPAVGNGRTLPADAVSLRATKDDEVQEGRKPPVAYLPPELSKPGATVSGKDYANLEGLSERTNEAIAKHSGAYKVDGSANIAAEKEALKAASAKAIAGIREGAEGVSTEDMQKEVLNARKDAAAKLEAAKKIKVELPAEGQVKQLAGGMYLDSKGNVRNIENALVATLGDDGKFVNAKGQALGDRKSRAMLKAIAKAETVDQHMMMSANASKLMAAKAALSEGSSATRKVAEGKQKRARSTTFDAFRTGENIPTATVALTMFFGDDVVRKTAYALGGEQSTSWFKQVHVWEAQYEGMNKTDLKAVEEWRSGIEQVLAGKKPSEYASEGGKRDYSRNAPPSAWLAVLERAHRGEVVPKEANAKAAATLEKTLPGVDKSMIAAIADQSDLVTTVQPADVGNTKVAANPAAASPIAKEPGIAEGPAALRPSFSNELPVERGALPAEIDHGDSYNSAGGGRSIDGMVQHNMR